MIKKGMIFTNKKINSLLLNPLLLIIFIYLISRLVSYLFFDLSYIYNRYLMHLLDIDWLKRNFFQSILFEHSQPPLFNIIFGLSEIIFKEYSKTFNFFLFHLMSITTAVLSYKILILIKVNTKLSVIIIILYILTPSTILYENWFFYTQMVIFFLILGGFNLLVYLIYKKKINLMVYMFSLLLISLTSSFFHLFWVVLLISLPIIFFKSNRRTIIKSSLFPLLVLLSLYLKNYIIFDQFSTSSWPGMNFARITMEHLDENKKKQLISENKLSKVSSFNGFPNRDGFLFFYESYFKHPTKVEALDKKFKSDNSINFNNQIIISLSKDALRDDIFVVTNFPEVYFKGVKEAFLLYFHSPSNYNQLDVNRNKLYIYNRFFDSFFYGAGRYTKTGMLTIFLYPIIIIISFFIVFGAKTSNLSKLFIIYALINIIYVMFVGNLFELGENNRFRFHTEIFYYILIGIIIQRVVSGTFSKNKQIN